jgi:hypothetical protein
MNVLSSDWASEKFGNTTIAERPIVIERNTIMSMERVIFNMPKKLKFLYLNLP